MFHVKNAKKKDIYIVKIAMGTERKVAIPAGETEERAAIGVVEADL